MCVCVRACERVYKFKNKKLFSDSPLTLFLFVFTLYISYLAFTRSFTWFACYSTYLLFSIPFNSIHFSMCKVCVCVCWSISDYERLFEHVLVHMCVAATGCMAWLNKYTKHIYYHRNPRTLPIGKCCNFVWFFNNYQLCVCLWCRIISNISKKELYLFSLILSYGSFDFCTGWQYIATISMWTETI